jgi:hypothetical protein
MRLFRLQKGKKGDKEMRKIVLFGILTGVVSTLSAQETPAFAVDIGAGFTTGVGHTGDFTDTGWNVRGGAGYNFSPYFGVLIDAGYNSLGVNSTELTSLGYGGGNVNIFSATLDPVVHLMPHSHVGVYVTGGAGWFREEQQFTQPGIINGTGFSPFFGYFPVAYGANIVVSDYSTNRPGMDAGIGVELGSKWGGKFFAEARYERIFMGNFHTDYLPVTFGFRR